MEEVIETFENGKMKTRKCYKNGLLHGLCQIWNCESQKPHQLVVEENYVNGEIHGIMRWWANGCLWLEENFVNGKGHGLRKEWEPYSGKKTFETEYVNGVKISEKKYTDYNLEGNDEWLIPYKNIRE